MSPKFEMLDEVPSDKFKGIYTKIAKEYFDRLLAHPEMQGGYYEDKQERILTGVYNAMQSLIRQGKHNFLVSIDNKTHRIWIKKIEGVKT